MRLIASAKCLCRGARRLHAGGGRIPACAQDIEPRAYSNAPVGVNFLIAGYAYTRGGVAFGPSLPITNPNLNTSSAVIAYARVLDLWGMSAKFDATVPYTWLSGTADYQGTNGTAQRRWLRQFRVSAVGQSLRRAGTHAEGVRRLGAGPDHRRQLSGGGALEPIR